MSIFIRGYLNFTDYAHYAFRYQLCFQLPIIKLCRHNWESPMYGYVKPTVPAAHLGHFSKRKKILVTTQIMLLISKCFDMLVLVNL